MMLSRKRLPSKLGQKAEKQAKQLLLRKGYRFITANYHSRYGEIDLIFQDRNELVFVEVKARQMNAQVKPEEAVTPQKLRRITITAEAFMQEHPDLPALGRIDVVTLDESGLVLRHIVDVVNH